MAAERLHLTLLLAVAFLTDHRSPHGISFPCNLFPLVYSELARSLRDIPTSDALRIKKDKTVDGIIQSIPCRLPEGVCIVNDFMHVVVFELIEKLDSSMAAEEYTKFYFAVSNLVISADKGELKKV